MKQDTRERLLRAGRRSFARHGFDGASVRTITRTARANLGAITYHFGSKRNFYDAVLESCVQPLARATVSAAHGSGAASERVGAVVRAYFEQLSSNPDIGRLILQELVLGKTPSGTALLPIRQIHGALAELIREGQARGEFRAGDPVLLAITTVSGAVHMNLVRRALKSVIGIDFDEAATRERIIEHVIAFACAGLAHEGSVQ
ncbi:MAG: TetR family transcriptional regulator [Gemmatimonadota bacterium]